MTNTKHYPVLASLHRKLHSPLKIERCELCSAKLAPEHEHLVELAKRRLLCSCQACAILFPGRAGAKFGRVPRRVQWLADFRMSDVQWEALNLPIKLAFFMNNSAAGRVVAFYPSPGGATEFLPALEAWQEFTEVNPVLLELAPDVEALLVNRLGPEPEIYRVGIDKCYELVGLIRSHWTGFWGGPVWDEIGRFFDALRKSAGAPRSPAHA